MTGRGRMVESGLRRVYGGRDEFSDDCLSQDEDSGQNSDYRNVVSFMPGTSKQRPLQHAKPSTSKSKGNKTSNKSGHSTASDLSHSGAGQSSYADKGVMTVNFNVEDKVFTRAFFIQIFIIMALCTLWFLMFTMYSNHTQEIYLKKNLDSILHVTKTGQKMIDKTINDKVSIRVPVLISNSTPAMVDSMVTEWIDQYIDEKLPLIVSSYVGTKYGEIKLKCKNEVEDLTDHLVSDAEAEIEGNVKIKLKPKIEENINTNLGQLVEEQVKTNFDSTIQDKVKSYVDSQIPVKGPRAVKEAIDTDEVRLMLHDALDNTVNRHVTDKLSPLIEKYTSDDGILKDTDDKLVAMFDQRLAMVDMSNKVDEVLVTDKLSQRIRNYAESLLETEYAGQIDSKVKAKVVEIVDNHRVHVGKFNTDADSKLQELKNVIDQMDEKKREFGILNLDSLLSRQDRQATLLWFLSIIVIVMLVCVYWLCFMRNGKSGNTLGRTNMVWPESAQAGRSNHPEILPGPVKAGRSTHPELESENCVILYNKKIKGDIERLIENLNIPNFIYDFVIIKDQAHIDNLPTYKSYLMCVEFSERHVIIEMPNLGLGDMKKNTYDKIMSKGAQLILLYIKDPGSRDLKDIRYNNDISRIKHQKELTQLTERDCFFSIYNKFSAFQAKQLKEKLTEKRS